MGRSQTLVQLTDELVAQLDRRARVLGVSRSQLVRTLLIEGLGDARRAERSAAMVEGYARAPQSDAWGDLDEWTERNGRRNFGALGDEERTPS